MAKSHLTTASAARGSSTVAHLPEPGIIIYIMVDSATATVDLITAHGGQIVKPIDPKASEITAHFRDPGGNILGIFENRG
jgi:predicted enzyme related to lactoylglutathione lyase